MTVVGIFLFVVTVFLIFFRYYSADRRYPFPRYGYAGAAILLAGELLMFAGVEPVATYFTPTAWTGYILWADAAVFSLQGRSLLKSFAAEFAWIVACSIPLWLIFEAYNLRLANWVYVGLPENIVARNFGYGWSFATIWPGIFETAALLRALSRHQRSVVQTDTRTASDSGGGHRPISVAASLIAVAGLLLLAVPPLLPQRISAYLFGAVWLGFILLLEPVNYRTGRESLWRDFKQGRTSRMVSLLGAGLICGIFWEFWNFWAPARWVYTVPILPEWKIFAMPLPGYLGFPPFAVECFVLFAFLVPVINAMLRKLGFRKIFRAEALHL
ncbi:MAG: hypothetical protein IH935_00140 [Acidobacteria bacterium]|nr:hypothetical protein [Acidobacteriota bacterium]MCH8267783.1 hypothetical protein [Acidobacteriota bacterium]MCZ6491540.1 hypothetical protein [Acidobacteriota bacterium]MCZ6751014.1 hypothetical protein [Acidobacteriota bacterium]